MLFRRLHHALRQQHFELMADLLGFTVEFVQELAFLVINDAVGEEHLPEPAASGLAPQIVDGSTGVSSSPIKPLCGTRAPGKTARQEQ
jgi:hypothetical protein